MKDIVVALLLFCTGALFFSQALPPVKTGEWESGKQDEKKPAEVAKPKSKPAQGEPKEAEDQIKKIMEAGGPVTPEEAEITGQETVEVQAARDALRAILAPAKEEFGPLMEPGAYDLRGLTWYGRSTNNRFGGPAIFAAGERRPGSTLYLFSGGLEAGKVVLLVGTKKLDLEVGGVQFNVHPFQTLVVDVTNLPGCAMFKYDLPKGRRGTLYFQWVQRRPEAVKSSSVGLAVEVK